MTGRRIVADVGGTRSRFGISGGPGDLSEIRVYPTAGKSSFADALATYVIDIGAGPVLPIARPPAITSHTRCPLASRASRCTGGSRDNDSG